MKIAQLIQGTPEWHAHRAQHFNASDAPAMLGLSPYKTRAQLVREMATGVCEEVDEATQRRFDDGHRFEALARPLAEAIVGEDLYPCVGVDGKFSASFDGLTMLEDTAFEHKSLNAQLRSFMHPNCEGDALPEHYQVQMEQQCMVSGAERVLFMASKWDGDELVEERHCWYYPDEELRAHIVAGWEQFEADVAAYVPEAAAAPISIGRAPDQMPALLIEVTGQVTASNLASWKDQAIAVFQGISTELVTDQDFADAERTVKWCGDIEDQLKGAKQHALSQTASIDDLFRTIDAISEEARATRLKLDKLVKARKDERRSEIGNDARRAVQDHVRGINETLGEHGIPMPATLIPDISAAMKGKKSFSSMQEAVSATVANAKIAASQQADRVRANVAILAEAADHASLFADRVQLCASKAPEDLRNLVAARVADYQKREAERIEREREKIRQEEADRLVREQEEAARVERERQAAEEKPAPAPEPVAQPAPAVAPAPVAAVPRTGLTRTVVASAGARIKLGDINARIAPLSIAAEGLATLGFEPVGTERAAKLYRLADVPLICEAMGKVLARAADLKEAA